jgi:Rieske Fe-S protein
VSGVRAAEGLWAAFDATCPHQQCAVEHVPAARLFACPCHGSTFDEKGQVTRGPAAAPLKALEVGAPFDPAQAVIKIR